MYFSTILVFLDIKDFAQDCVFQLQHISTHAKSYLIKKKSLSKVPENFHRSGWFGLLTARSDISEGIFVVYLKAFRATGSSSATGQKDKRSTTMNSFHFPFLTGSRPVH